jgi:threonine/homoserine/homoserine lactone efflux protein
VTANSILAFSVLAALLTVLPGSDFAFTLRWALRGGPSGAFAAALGIAIGSLCWATASAVGLVELLRASRLGYDALRVTGAAYLILLGVQSLRGSSRGEGTVIAVAAGRSREDRHRQYPQAAAWLEDPRRHQDSVKTNYRSAPFLAYLSRKDGS